MEHLHGSWADLVRESMRDLADFEVWIGSSASQSPVFPVQVYRSPAGPAKGTMSLDVHTDEFRTILAHVCESSPDLDLRKAFGEQLFTTLFTAGPVRDAWYQSRGRIDGANVQGLRLLLWIDVPELAILPWELLWDGEFLATATDLTVARYLPVREPPACLGQQQLRILIVVESPDNVPPIDPKEVAELEAALQSLGKQVQYHTLYNASPAKIQAA